MRAEVDIPSELEPPELADGFGGWYEDFWDLSTERQIGMGAGPIPQSAIDRHVAGWRYDDADMFCACIRAMDSLWLDMANKRDDEGGDQGGADDNISARDAFKDATGRQRRGGGRR